jgi:iron complex transport system substrate-binding protein
MIHRIFCLAALIGFAGCGTQTRKSGPSSVDTAHYTNVPVRYAAGFEIKRNGANSIITVSNPWQLAEHIAYTYLLSDTASFSRILPDNQWIIKTPIQRAVCLSTTHIGFIDFIGKTKSITGISGNQYVVNSGLIARIAQGDLQDVGYDENLNYELLLKLRPDVVFAYGVSGTITNTISKLNELGIPCVMIAEYLEEQPLAKMEWVKVFASFYQCADSAGQMFDSVAWRYNRLCSLAREEKDKPAVLMGLPWRGTWYISGGKSYIAQLVSDAGGRYLWEDLDFKDSRPLPLEKVFEKAQDAEYWLNPGDARTIQDILSVDQRFNKVPSLLNRNVYNNNNKMSTAGGNAFYESGVTEPDRILSDIIYILHPQLLPSHNLQYYQKLE